MKRWKKGVVLSLFHNMYWNIIKIFFLDYLLYVLQFFFFFFFYVTSRLKHVSKLFCLFWGGFPAFSSSLMIYLAVFDNRVASTVTCLFHCFLRHLKNWLISSIAHFSLISMFLILSNSDLPVVLLRLSSLRCSLSALFWQCLAWLQWRR